MLKEADVDNDGFISRQEWIDVMLKNRDSQNKTKWSVLKIFDNLGGQETVNKIVELFYSRILENPALNVIFKGRDVMAISKAQTQYIAQSIGAPTPWQGRTLREIHRGLMINEEAFDEYVSLFVKTAIDVGIPSQQAEGFRYSLNRFKNQVIELGPKQLEQLKNSLHQFFWNQDDSQLNLLFDAFDRNGNGYINFEEFDKTLKTLYSDYLDPFELEQMFKEADVSNTKQIEREMWKKTLRKHREMNDSDWKNFKIYEKIGGQEIVNKLVLSFYSKVQSHPELKYYFQGKDIERIAQSQLQYIAQAVGAPMPWKGQSLEAMHRGLNITTEAFDSYVDLFVQTAKECGLSRQDCNAFMFALLRYKNLVINK